MKKNLKIILGRILTTILVMTLLSVAVYATPHLIPLQGLASDSSDNPLATGDISVRIYDAATGGNLVYDSGTDFNGAIQDGIYDFLLSVDLDNTLKYYMEIDVNGEEVVGDATSGRQAFWPGSGDHTHDESWNDLLDIPVGFSDGVDDMGVSLWSQLNNNIYYNVGNVGIGTPNPVETLDVNGDIRVRGGNVYDATGDLKFSSEDSVYINMDFNNNDANIRGIIFGKNSISTPTELMRIAESGNVGIGTDSPQAKLDVVGKVRISGGSPGAGKLLTSDANGFATWEPAPVCSCDVSSQDFLDLLARVEILEGSCTTGLTKCGNACVNTLIDESHCGGCSKACAQGQTCVSGACTLVCSGGTTKCGNTCVDILTDAANCGGCSKACAQGQTCVSGACTLVCSGGTTKCGNTCVDISTDAANCGGCSKACAQGQTCVSGACTLVCSGGTTKCGNTCVDISTDAANCGGCSKACAQGQTCVSGACTLVCSGGTTKCGNTCVDISTDAANCGGCSKACAQGQTCNQGACV